MRSIARHGRTGRKGRQGRTSTEEPEKGDTPMEYTALRDFCHICSRWGPCFHTIYQHELTANYNAGLHYPEAMCKAQDTAKAVHYAPTPAPAPAPKPPKPRATAAPKPKPKSRSEPTEALIEQWDQYYRRVDLVKARRAARRQNLMVIEERYQSQIQTHAQLFCNRLIEERWPDTPFSMLRMIGRKDDDIQPPV